jgi:hypothetical protein
LRNVKLRVVILAIMYKQTEPVTSGQVLDLMLKNRARPSTTKIGSLLKVMPEIERIGGTDPYLWRIKKCYGQKNTGRNQ